MDRPSKRCRVSSQVDSRIFHWDVLLEVERTCPYRKPDWRWRLALGLAIGKKDLPANCPDKWLLLASRYCRLAASPFTAAKCDTVEFEPIRCTVVLHKSEGLKRDLIQSLLLERASMTDIAGHCQVQIETVKAYEALFFNQRQTVPAESCKSLRTDCELWPIWSRL
jgi:hypothetical protein